MKFKKTKSVAGKHTENVSGNTHTHTHTDTYTHTQDIPPRSHTHAACDTHTHTPTRGFSHTPLKFRTHTHTHTLPQKTHTHKKRSSTTGCETPAHTHTHSNTRAHEGRDTHTHKPRDIHTHTHKPGDTHTQTHKPKDTHTHRHEKQRAHSHTHTDGSDHDSDTRTHTHTNTHTGAQRQRSEDADTHTRTHTHTHTDTDTHTDKHTDTDTPTDTHTYATNDPKGFYKCLGVPIDADDADIRKAYKRKALECHPDKNPDNPAATQKFQELATAYAVLQDAEKRQRYNFTGAVDEEEESYDDQQDGMGFAMYFFESFFNNMGFDSFTFGDFDTHGIEMFVSAHYHDVPFEEYVMFSSDEETVGIHVSEEGLPYETLTAIHAERNSSHQDKKKGKAKSKNSTSGIKSKISKFFHGKQTEAKTTSEEESVYDVLDDIYDLSNLFANATEGQSRHTTETVGRSKGTHTHTHTHKHDSTNTEANAHTKKRKNKMKWRSKSRSKSVKRFAT